MIFFNSLFATKKKENKKPRWSIIFVSYDEELRQKHQFLIAGCKNDTKTKIHQYSLTGLIVVFEMMS